MYPVQVMISYFTTSFTVIMHIGREVTAKQYTGGGLQDSKGTYKKKQAQEWVRLVSSSSLRPPKTGIGLFAVMTAKNAGLINGGKFRMNRNNT